MNNAIAQLINEINQELAVINNKTLAINVLCTRIQELHREGTREDYFIPIESTKVYTDEEALQQLLA